MKRSAFLIAALAIPMALGFAPQAAAETHVLEILPPDSHIVTELGDSQTFAVALSSRPASKVILKVLSDDTSEGTVDKDRIEFLRENWNEPQLITVKGMDDKVPDGTRKFNVRLMLDYTKDDNYRALPTERLQFECLDDETAPNTDYKALVKGIVGKSNPKRGHKTPQTSNTDAKKYRIRIMTANTTSGEDQSYDDGEGIRIFKAMKPDIVLIQEFNYSKNSIKSFVASTFGPEYSYHRGTGKIPNGIISRYPIKSSGAWKSNRVSDRQWDWAVIDIPGERDLLAVSVHLYTQDNEAEMTPLISQIKNKLKTDAYNYYVILGGDFNQPDWKPIQNHLGGMFEVGTKYADWPQDQEGMVKTNATRHKQLDYLLCSPDFCALETATLVGNRAYPRGHVVDSRVYKKHNELSAISPVKAEDSAAHKMQHMAVIRDFEIVATE
ncbi:MAG: hypothetical protein IJ165_01120 [Proteobacteria bacterium]|nr:hypothetical protein [Pseudomonadota bacterium]